MITIASRLLKSALCALALLVMGTLAQPVWAAPCAGPAETKDITFMASWLPWSGDAPFFTAQLNGYFGDEGISVQIEYPANPADPIKMVAAGRAQFSTTYVPEVMLSREADVPVVSVAAILRTLVSGLMFVGDTPINKPADLKGMTLGVGPKQDAQAYLRTMLKTGGLTLDDVDVVDPGFGHVPLLVAGKVTAVHGLTYGEGVIADEVLTAEGRPKVRWLMYRDYGVPAFYYVVLVANESWVKGNPNAVCHFLAALQKGAQEFVANPGQTNKFMADNNEIFTLPQHTAISAATTPDWKTSDGRYFVQDSDVWKLAQDWALSEGLISKKVNHKLYYSNDYLPN